MNVWAIVNTDSGWQVAECSVESRVEDIVALLWEKRDLLAPNGVLNDLSCRTRDSKANLCLSDSQVYLVESAAREEADRLNHIHVSHIKLTEVQERLYAWQVRNFPVVEKTALHCCLGVVEELGEMRQAWEKLAAVLVASPAAPSDSYQADWECRKAQNEAEVKDAIGDVAVYLMNLCSAKSWNIGSVIYEHLSSDKAPRQEHISIAIGRLAHAILKADQGIRKNEDLEAIAKDAIFEIWNFLAAFCEDYEWRFENIVSEVAERILQRDWIKNPETAVNSQDEGGT